MARSTLVKFEAYSYDTAEPSVMDRLIYSDEDDYEEVYRARIITTGSYNIAATLVDISTINVFYVRNLDSTNYATLTYTSTGNGLSRVTRIPAGTFVVLSDVSSGSAITLAAAVSTVVLDVLVMGD